MDSVSIGETLLLSTDPNGRQSQFQVVFLNEAYIGESLDTRASSFVALDLTDARIGRTLFLGSPERTVKWAASNDGGNQPVIPTLKLRTATVGTLVDSEAAWPRELELAGFTYDRLRDLQADPKGRTHPRESEWYVEWLARDKSYTAQPYRQLAGFLEASGHHFMAADILYASREREREEARPENFLHWLSLSVLKFTIGYGYGLRYLRAVVWVAALTLIGMVLLRRAGEHLGDGTRLGFWYSLDTLLPGIKLREAHYDVDLSDKLARRYFYFHKLAGFVLVSFVIAGLAGLTE